MAPLPLFHRPLSQDNSRETSLSSGRGGGRSTGPDTSHSGGSGSGVSLPMRGQTGVKTPNTPDTPSASTVISGSIPNAASSDYLIPLTGNMARPKNIKTHHRQSVTSHATTGTPVSSPSDEPASEESDEGSNQDETSSGRTHLRLKIGIWNLKSDKKFWILVYFFDMQWRKKNNGKYFDIYMTVIYFWNINIGMHLFSRKRHVTF